MKIVLVSNKPDLEDDYSDFVNSCDIVVRINKLDSITYGKTGKKTDIIQMRLWNQLYESPDTYKYLDIIQNSKKIFISIAKGEQYTFYLFKNKLKCDEKIIIVDLKRNTAVTDALETIRNLYPNKKIYYIGDKSTYLRTGSDHHNNSFNNDLFFHNLEEDGILIPVINNDNYLEYWIENGNYTGYYTIINKTKIIYNNKNGILKHIKDDYYQINWCDDSINYLNLKNKTIDFTYNENLN